MKLSELKSFMSALNSLNSIYKDYFSKNRLTFPEPLQKEIIKTLYDSNLKLAPKSSYDFQENVELKSSAAYGGGCTPFKSTQNACTRIIYVEIGANFDVYEIDISDVQAINQLVSSGTLNITLSNYKQKAVHKRII